MTARASRLSTSSINGKLTLVQIVEVGEGECEMTKKATKVQLFLVNIFSLRSIQVWITLIACSCWRHNWKFKESDHFRNNYLYCTVKCIDTVDNLTQYLGFHNSIPLENLIALVVRSKKKLWFVKAAIATSSLNGDISDTNLNFVFACLVKGLS